MGPFHLLIALAFATSFVVGNKGDVSRLEEMIEALRSDIEQLRRDKDSEITLLKNEISGMKTELQSSDAPLLFDCYLSEFWLDDGIIHFDGCSGKFRKI